MGLDNVLMFIFIYFMKGAKSILLKEILNSTLGDDNLSDNPLTIAKQWYEDANEVVEVDSTAMSLATCGNDKRPSLRIILLKKIDDRGFIFYTNYTSRKANQIDENRNVALVGFWPELKRQIRVEGVVEKLSNEESDKYYDSRPEGSRIGAWASPQSKVIPGRYYLDNLKIDFDNALSGKVIDRPEFWGGYIIIPERIEFWKEREDRLHDRIEYLKIDGVWSHHRLAP